ncbi:MAG: hypothetical protein IPJ65_30860 [Archangiaceae bacterium]|nr:hypothetical protein [Archangiaceae bacterium]
MRLLVLVSAVLALAACKSNCRQLSERLCECAVNSVEKDTCVRTAAAAEGANPPSPTDETYCAGLLKPADGGYGCDCRLIDTREGKIRCGLARPGPAQLQTQP